MEHPPPLTSLQDIPAGPPGSEAVCLYPAAHHRPDDVLSRCPRGCRARRPFCIAGLPTSILLRDALTTRD
jgi:hypothetical protein